MKGNAQISSFGRFKNTRGIISKPLPKKDGYSMIAINKKRYMTHIVVATTFKLPRKEGQNYVNHKNLDTSDSRISNLEWVTRSENIKHSYSFNKNRKLNATKRVKPVRARKLGTDEWIVYSGGASEAARILQVNVGQISVCCAKAKYANQTGGYEFEWDEPTEPNLLKGEEWRNVSDKGAAVSSHGRYRNIYGVVSTPTVGKAGYVNIKFDGKCQKIHRVIATAFGLPRKEGADQIDHIDGNRSNNKLSNLEWVTRSENVTRSYKNNNERKSCARKLCKPIRARVIGACEWTLYPGGLCEAKRNLNINQLQISKCCQGKMKHYGGYEFEYAASTEPELLPGEEWRDVILPLYKFTTNVNMDTI